MLIGVDCVYPASTSLYNPFGTANTIKVMKIVEKKYLFYFIGFFFVPLFKCVLFIKKILKMNKQSIVYLIFLLIIWLFYSNKFKFFKADQV